jgi:hypothetical protein
VLKKMRGQVPVSAQWNLADAAAFREVFVPPVALFFSLMGAVGHLAKPSYFRCTWPRQGCLRRKPS